jgi:hypothetical protein
MNTKTESALNFKKEFSCLQHFISRNLAEISNRLSRNKTENLAKFRKSPRNKIIFHEIKIARRSSFVTIYMMVVLI